MAIHLGKARSQAAALAPWPAGRPAGGQGQGIGSRLLESFCEHLGRLQAAGYLETDRLENVRLYERFGFSVTGEAPVYGARIYVAPPTSGRSVTEWYRLPLNRLKATPPHPEMLSRSDRPSVSSR